MKKKIALSVGALLAVATMSAVPATALAHPPALSHSIFGTLKSITPGTGAVITTATGDVTVTLVNHTKFIPNSPAAVAEDGIQIGNAVSARVTRGRHQSWIALSIRYDTAPFVVGPQLRVQGRYVSNTDAQLTIMNRRGSFTFNWDVNTKFVEDGQVVSNPNFAVGEDISVRAENFTDGSMYAIVIDIFTPNPPHARIFVGVYTSNTDSQLVITSQTGNPFTFSYDQNTVFVQGRHVTTNPSFSTGERVQVWSQKQTDGSWYAKYVRLFPNHPAKTHLQKFFGTYSSNTDSQLVVTNGKGTALTFGLTSNTVFVQHFRVITNPTFTSGEHIGVLAVVNPGVSMTATIVWLFPGKSS